MTDQAINAKEGEKMNHSILYYPTIEFQPRDYSNIYDEFLRMIYPKEIYSGCAVNKALDIQYNIDEWNEKFVKSKYSEKQRLALLKDFLFVGLSLKKLEEKHFGEAKNGWLAMSIRNSYGIENEQKGSLKKLSLDEAIATSSGELKKLLEKIKEVLT